MSKIFDYGFELFMGALLIFFVLLIAWLVITLITPTKCSNSTFECRKIQFDECMKSELYSRSECINLIGTNGS